MQERAERAVDERGRLVQLEVAHVALPEVERDACLGGAGAGVLQHPRRGVDPEDRPARRLRNGDRDAAVPDRELDERPVRGLRQSDIEGDVLRHVRRPLLVAVREALVPAHGVDATRRRCLRSRSRLGCTRFGSPGIFG